MLSAMIFRMRLMGSTFTRSPAAKAGTAGAGATARAGMSPSVGAEGSCTAGSAGAMVADAVAPLARWASRSSLVTRPAWPVPDTRARSTPCWRAISRTRGLLLVLRRPSRLLSSSTPMGWTAAARGAAAGAAGAVAGAAAAPAGFSEASPMRATTAPTGTVVFTSTRISRRVPAAGAGISASTLSVLIS